MRSKNCTRATAGWAGDNLVGESRGVRYNCSSEPSSGGTEPNGLQNLFNAVVVAHDLHGPTGHIYGVDIFNTNGIVAGMPTGPCSSPFLPC